MPLNKWGAADTNHSMGEAKCEIWNVTVRLKHKMAKYEPEEQNTTPVKPD